jgi:hypothetical protein
MEIAALESLQGRLQRDQNSGPKPGALIALRLEWPSTNTIPGQPCLAEAIRSETPPNNPCFGDKF